MMTRKVPCGREVSKRTGSFYVGGKCLNGREVSMRAGSVYSVRKRAGGYYYDQEVSVRAGSVYPGGKFL